jgi:hypothetical protein
LLRLKFYEGGSEPLVFSGKSEAQPALLVIAFLLRLRAVTSRLLAQFFYVQTVFIVHSNNLSLRLPHKGANHY